MCSGSHVDLTTCKYMCLYVYSRSTHPVLWLVEQTPHYDPCSQNVEVLFSSKLSPPCLILYQFPVCSCSNAIYTLVLSSPEWTVALTKYMQECVWRICNDSHSHSRYEGVSSSHRSGSIAGGSGSVSQDDGCSIELSRWKYMMELSSWLYQVRGRGRERRNVL